MKKIVLLIIGFIVLSSCSKANNKQPKNLTVFKKKTELRKNVGLVFYNDTLFTGTTEIYYPNGNKAETIDYLNGKRNGAYKKWFSTGVLSYHSNYKNGKQQGITKSWWINGNLRSKTNHDNGVLNGVQKQWYKSGEKFKELNIVNGQEKGIQRTWRKNGKLYNNYEAKNGRIFGLKRANLCYELKNEDVQINN